MTYLKLKTSRSLTQRIVIGLTLLVCGISNAYSLNDELLDTLEKVMPEMIKVSAGTFIMGDSHEEGDADEQPAHSVNVPAFALAKYETTYDLYDVYAESVGKELPGDEGRGRAGYPVLNVSWQEAVEFTQWLSEQTGREFRLPTEAEWEYAARAGSDTVYPWGKSMSREHGNYGQSNCCSNGPFKEGRDQWDYSGPVGKFEPNAWGFHDMQGNLQEWAADCWNTSYAGAPTDGSAWLEGNCERSPLRGGSWNHHSRNLRPANRNSNVRNSSIGVGFTFRIAETINLNAVSN